jgi:drug/metabolite transporter (DMT)-like permease
MIEENKNKVLAADLALLLVAIIWGSGFIVTKITLEFIPPLLLTGLRFWIGFIIMGVIAKAKGLKPSSADLKGGIIVGIALFLAYTFQTYGIQFTTVSKSAFLTGTNVIMVPFLYWIISKKRPDTFSFIAAIICLVGIYFLTVTGGGLNLGLGDSLTLACAVFFALHITTNGHYAKKIDVILLTTIQFGTVAILSTVPSLFLESIPTNAPSIAWLGIIYCGIVSTSIAFFLQTLAQKYTLATHAAIILSTESVFGTLFSVLILHEFFSFKAAFGCFTILMAIITAETKWEFLYKKRDIAKQKKAG